MKLISKKRTIVLVVPDIRSIHNVGSLLRTAEGLGIHQVILCGYTPHPSYAGDPRLPHHSAKQTKQIAKTALGAEQSSIWRYRESATAVIEALKSDDYLVIALEQAPGATALPQFEPPTKLALVLGREVEGISPELLNLCDGALEIPMFGHKESFNVVEAASMALYHCRFAA